MSEVTEIIEESSTQLEIIETGTGQIEIVGEDKNIIEVSFSEPVKNPLSSVDTVGLVIIILLVIRLKNMSKAT